jgi:hypothetical protein
MDFERNYPIKPLSNQIINKRFYSSDLPKSVQPSTEKDTNINLNP